MVNQRTAHWKILSRFYLLCLPFGIVFTVIFSAFALPFLLAFGTTLFLYWQFTRFVTNSVVKHYMPETYDQMQKVGCDPFYNSLGAPLNFDSDGVRIFGSEPNANCPLCFQLMLLEEGTTGVCGNCGSTVSFIGKRVELVSLM